MADEHVGLYWIFLGPPSPPPPPPLISVRIWCWNGYAQFTIFWTVKTCDSPPPHPTPIHSNFLDPLVAAKSLNPKLSIRHENDTFLPPPPITPTPTPGHATVIRLCSANYSKLQSFTPFKQYRSLELSVRQSLDKAMLGVKWRVKRLNGVNEEVTNYTWRVKTLYNRPYTPDKYRPIYPGQIQANIPWKIQGY